MNVCDPGIGERTIRSVAEGSCPTSGPGAQVTVPDTDMDALVNIPSFGSNPEKSALKF
jgi:hypothetical protein